MMIVTTISTCLMRANPSAIITARELTDGPVCASSFRESGQSPMLMMLMMIPGLQLPSKCVGCQSGSVASVRALSLAAGSTRSPSTSDCEFSEVPAVNSCKAHLPASLCSVMSGAGRQQRID